MSTMKKIWMVLVMQVAAIGIILGVVAVWFAWAYNTPITNNLMSVVEGTQRVLTASDAGLRVVNSGLRTALGAATAVDTTTRSTGERIVETNFAFLVLERAVGDRLFPRVIAAHETVTALASTVIGINDTLEAANRLPFVEVPTFTTQLGEVGSRLNTARGRIDELQAGIRQIKQDKISRPVSFVTDRTGGLMRDLDAALTITTDAQMRILITMAQLEALQQRLPLIIDLISITTTLIAAWLIGVQAYVMIRAYERLAGKTIDWGRIRAGNGDGKAPTEPPSATA